MTITQTPDFPILLRQPLTLEDVWLAYRRGATEAREACQRGTPPTDEQIERSCDGYTKLILIGAA